MKRNKNNKINENARKAFDEFRTEFAEDLNVNVNRNNRQNRNNVRNNNQNRKNNNNNN